MIRFTNNIDYYKWKANYFLWLLDYCYTEDEYKEVNEEAMVWLDLYNKALYGEFKVDFRFDKLGRVSITYS